MSGSKPWKSMAIAIRKKDGIQRPACMVWILDDGVVWIEPGYLADYPTGGHDMHYVKGKVDIAQNAIKVNGWELRYWDDWADFDNDVFDNLFWWMGELKRKGIKPEREMARLQEITPTLAD